VSVLLSLLLLSPTAAAFELWGTGPLASSSVQVTSDFQLRYHQSTREEPGFEDSYPNLHDYFEQVERLNLLLNKDGLSIGAQLDEVALFSNRYYLDGELLHSWPLYEPGIVSPFPDALVRMEKLYVQKRWKNAEVTLGDTYASFGRGMALNIVKNTDIDVDTSIRGGKALLRAGDLELNLVSGLSNTQWISINNQNLGIDRDVKSMVTGLRADAYGLGRVHMGLHGVMYRFGRQDSLGQPGGVRYTEPLDAVVSGATVEVPGLAGIDLFAEGDYFGYRSDDLIGDGEPDGYSTYASAAAYPGRTTLLLEARRSVNSERINAFVSADGWEVATVPSLEYERTITEDGSAALNSSDISGARLRADYNIEGVAVVPFVSVAAFRDEDVGGLHFNQSAETIGHALAGLQWLGGPNTVQVNGGLRRDIRDDQAEGYDQLAHVDSAFHVSLGEHNALELDVGVRKFNWGNNVAQQEDFTELENALAWHHGETLAFLIYQDYSDNPLITSSGNISEKIYGAGELQWKPSGATAVSLFYGAYKAGIRCSGGQCRSLPGFEGGRFAWRTTF
jgi:hypothetical protein